MGDPRPADRINLFLTDQAQENWFGLSSVEERESVAAALSYVDPSEIVPEGDVRSAVLPTGHLAVYRSMSPEEVSAMEQDMTAFDRMVRKPEAPYYEVTEIRRI